MSRTRFDTILKCIFYTSDEPPAYRDGFWEVRQESKRKFHSGVGGGGGGGWGWGSNCLDESMIVCTNKCTCPGWMSVAQKPWPFGNEYHTVCCFLSGVLWGLELVEGKDTPRQTPPPMFQSLGNTVGLLLRILSPFFRRSFVVIRDSGFCILKGIIELKIMELLHLLLSRRGDTGPNIFVEKR